MSYKNKRIDDTKSLLSERFDTLVKKSDILNAPELKSLYSEIPKLPADQRAEFGKEMNRLKNELQTMLDNYQEAAEELPAIDVTAPFGINTPKDKRPKIGFANDGSRHPIMTELQKMADIYSSMGFQIEESRQIDDDYHMFESLNFPKDHPARGHYDTFTTVGGLIAPAHTSTMQNRVLKANKDKLDAGEPIAVVIPGRVFRNEDLDARHEHTFYQLEGVFVGKGANVGNLVATLKTFMSSYYQNDIEIKTQPFYFPFTEPSFEFAASCLFCSQKGCNICSNTGWIELGGCGMIHPNVLKMADIDPGVYSGFAWGFGVERQIMLKHNIEDVRHFESGKLDFLRQFS
jgi:phenylalanyl-tRNA synthetase alpha chain